MIKDITIGQYIPGNSPVHKLDPRIKILISFAFVIDLFLVNNFEGYIFIAGFIFFSVIISRVKFKFIFNGLKPIFVLLIFTAALNILMLDGKVRLFHWGFIWIYKEGVIIAAFMVMRLTFLIVGTSLLTLTTSPIELTDGIEKLLGPFKRIGLPAHELAMMMTIALRFIPTLIDETDKIMKAQMARGADFESGNIINRARNLIPLLVPLFISSFRRADDLAMAMESRCYRGGEGRTRMKKLTLTYRDAVASLVVVLLIVVSTTCKLWMG